MITRWLDRGGRLLTNSPDERGELFVATEGQDGAGDGCNDGREGEPVSHLVSLPDHEGVLKDSIHDASDTERRLNHRWYHIHNWRGTSFNSFM